ncbi:hypothetical protein MED222_05330 [Vibrio sp. MED222]|nr:hypothetical protein MED222_05330 [Vibrio sp. MED222]
MRVGNCIVKTSAQCFTRFNLCCRVHIMHFDGVT